MSRFEIITDLPFNYESTEQSQPVRFFRQWNLLINQWNHFKINTKSKYPLRLFFVVVEVRWCNPTFPHFARLSLQKRSIL